MKKRLARFRSGILRSELMLNQHRMVLILMQENPCEPRLLWTTISLGLRRSNRFGGKERAYERGAQGVD